MKLKNVVGVLLLLGLAACANKTNTLDVEKIEGTWKLEGAEAMYLSFDKSGAYIQNQIYMDGPKDAFYHQSYGEYSLANTGDLNFDRAYDHCSLDEEFIFSLKITSLTENEFGVLHGNGIEQRYSKVTDTERAMLKSAIAGLGVASNPDMKFSAKCITSSLYKDQAPVVSEVGSLAVDAIAKKKASMQLGENEEADEFPAPTKDQDPGFQNELVE